MFFSSCYSIFHSLDPFTMFLLPTVFSDFCCLAQPVPSNWLSCLPIIISHRTWSLPAHQHSTPTSPTASVAPTTVPFGFTQTLFHSLLQLWTLSLLSISTSIIQLSFQAVAWYHLFPSLSYFFFFSSSFSFTIYPSVFWFCSATSQKLLFQKSLMI